MNKRMLIITGPQGSGNHLFSKIFALHEDVFGWKTLLNTYWEGHHHEPFAHCWADPKELHLFDWSLADYYVTSVSCPYFRDNQPQIPDYNKFIEAALLHCDVDIAVIGRDQNILEHQQNRVRGMETTDLFLERLDDLYAVQGGVHFLSQELLYLYKQTYLERVADDLDWPIAYWDPEVDVILQQDANKKYVKRAEEYWLDFEVQKAVRES